MKATVARQHDAAMRAGTAPSVTHPEPRIETEAERVPNPLRVINIGMGVFFAAAAVLMAITL